MDNRLKSMIFTLMLFMLVSCYDPAFKLYIVNETNHLIKIQYLLSNTSLGPKQLVSVELPPSDKHYIPTFTDIRSNIDHKRNLKMFKKLFVIFDIYIEDQKIYNIETVRGEDIVVLKNRNSGHNYVLYIVRLSEPVSHTP